MRRILIIQTAFIGDVILAIPLIEKLHSFFPDVEIDFLVRRGNESLLSNNPHLHEVLIWDKRQAKYKNLLRIISKVRSKKYDTVIVVQRFLSTGLIAAFSGAKEIVGFDKNPVSFLFSKKVKHIIGTKEKPVHEVERNLNLIEDVTDGTFVRPKIYLSADDFEKVKTTGKYVCMAPASIWFTKQLPVKKWMEVIALIAQSNIIYLLGGKEDFEVCEGIRISSGRDNIRNLAGKLSLLESAALMKNAVMNYVNDSAPLHLASAVNAPVTAVFCSTIPEFGFGPLSDISKVVETSEYLDCRPCGLHGYRACPKGHFKCVEIDAMEIVTA